MNLSRKTFKGIIKVPFNPAFSLSIAGRPYISQLGGPGLQVAARNLILFEIGTSALEQATHFKWRVTSLCRMSPSHRRGVAVDLAPDIAPSSAIYYAVNHLSDPVLYKRERLIRLMQANLGRYLKIAPAGITFNYFIEPDHIHLHLSSRKNSDPPFRIVKFGGPKLCYKDSPRRSALPLHKGNRPVKSDLIPDGLK